MPVSTFLNGRGPTRGLLWLALSSTGYLWARTSASDGGGGQTSTYTKSSAIPCRIDPLAHGGEGPGGGRVSDQSTHAVTMRSGAAPAMTTGDDFEVDGGRFEITAIHHVTGEFVRVIEVSDRRSA